MAYGNPRRAQHYPTGVNNYVPTMQFHSHVGHGDGYVRADLDAPVALNNTGILAAASINVALDTSTFNTPYNRNAMGVYGRAVRVVLSGAGTPTITIDGRDYLGQPMTQILTGNGTTPVLGTKAFATIERVRSTLVAAVTLDVGWYDLFGLPFKGEVMVQENIDDRLATPSGTFVAAINTDPQTATTGDPRGTYAPAAGNAANGVRTYRIHYTADKNNLYGVRHFFGG